MFYFTNKLLARNQLNKRFMRLSFSNFHNPASAHVYFAESHLWFAGVREWPPWCSIAGATVTVHQFFCILHLIDTVAVTDKVESNLQIQYIKL